MKSWLDDRLNLKVLKELILLEPIPGGAKIAYVFGSMLLFLLILQILTGIFLMFYYAPTVDHAWDSIRYIMEDVDFGWMIRGIHHWASSAMVLLVVVHLLQVFIWGAYKKPRELVWLMGIFLLIMVLAMGFTGYLLPWDQKAYWASVVGMEMAGVAPGIGEFITKFLKGGDIAGVLTLNRFYVIHVWMIPFFLVTFVGMHLFFFRNAGPAGPYEGDPKELEKKKEFFYPKQIFIDLLAVLILFIILVLLSVFKPPELWSKANPAVSAFNPEPEWYFLFLFQLLKLPVFAGGFGEMIGAVLLPGAFLLLLILLPFFDKNPSRNPFKRPAAMGIMVLVMGGIIGLTTMSIATAPPSFPLNHKLAQKGLEIYYVKGQCYTCHAIAKLDEKVLGAPGPDIGPALTDESDRGRTLDWLVKHFKDPPSMTPDSVMPPADSLGLTQDDIVALAHFVSDPIKDIPDRELPELRKKMGQ